MEMLSVGDRRRFRRNQCVRHKDELLIFQFSCCHPSIISRCSLPRTNTQQKELHIRCALNGVIAVTRAMFRPLAQIESRWHFFRAPHLLAPIGDRRDQKFARVAELYNYMSITPPILRCCRESFRVFILRKRERPT